MVKAPMWRTLALAGLVGAVMGLVGCELAVTNPNQPDRSRALAAPEDVESLIGSAYGSWWELAHHLWPTMALEVASNHHTATWGNFGMLEVGAEPRQPLNNSETWTYYEDVFQEGWGDAYSAIAAANDGLRALEGGLEIGPGGERNARARAFATFMQGLGHCYLANLFDQAFVVDETTNLEEGDVPPTPYSQIMDFALQKLQAAAQMAPNMGMALPPEWINGNPLTPGEFQRLIRSYMARCRANLARSPSERAATDWNAVIADVDAGIHDLTIDGIEAFSGPPWWDGMKYYGVEENTWSRLHMDWIGQADQSGNYQAWLAKPIAQRTAVPVTTPDERYPPENVDGATGFYHKYRSTLSFRADRGTDRQSHYADERHTAYETSCGFCWFGPIVEFIPQEFDLMKAEGLLRNGDVAGAAALINKTRVGHGGLTPVTSAGTVPTEPGGGCVPRKRLDPSGTCGDMMDALQYEHYEEIFQISGFLTFWFTRGHGELPIGTALHLPIPAKDLQTLQMDIYTFGGVENAGEPGTAPAPTPSIVWGDLDSYLERAAWSLQALQLKREQENQRRPRGVQ